MSLFPPNNILVEEIFMQSNLGTDCDIIGGLLYRFGDKFISSALEDGEYAIAVRHYLQMLESLTRHFIVDEHWCWFDDFYSPDYTVSQIWDKFVPHIRSGALAGECLEELEAGLAEIEASEAYQEYHMPSMIPFHDLKNAKTFLERFGSHR
jgi:hypothetical protein